MAKEFNTKLQCSANISLLCHIRRFSVSSSWYFVSNEVVTVTEIS